MKNKLAVIFSRKTNTKREVTTFFDDQFGFQSKMDEDELDAYHSTIERMVGNNDQVILLKFSFTGDDVSELEFRSIIEGKLENGVYNLDIAIPIWDEDELDSLEFLSELVTERYKKIDVDVEAEST